MILTDAAILEEIEAGRIEIDPFDRSCLGCNSYDVHLSKHLACYKYGRLDAAKPNELVHFNIDEEIGFQLEPGLLYLGSTVERSNTPHHIPFLEGKSSVGRLGISIHVTAGKGDIGFNNYWTLEIHCLQSVRVYAGMPIGQLIFFQSQGQILTPYNLKQNAKYTNISPLPQGSAMYKNF